MTETKSAQQIWETTLDKLQVHINKSNYHTWFKRTIGLDSEDGQFVVGVPNAFVAEYLDRNQRSLIEKVLTGLTQQEVQVQFQVHNDPPNFTSRRSQLHAAELQAACDAPTPADRYFTPVCA